MGIFNNPFTFTNEPAPETWLPIGDTGFEIVQAEVMDEYTPMDYAEDVVDGSLLSPVPDFEGYDIVVNECEICVIPTGRVWFYEMSAPGVCYRRNNPDCRDQPFPPQPTRPDFPLPPGGEDGRELAPSCIVTESGYYQVWINHWYYHYTPRDGEAISDFGGPFAVTLGPIGSRYKTFWIERGGGLYRRTATISRRYENWQYVVTTETTFLIFNPDSMPNADWSVQSRLFSTTDVRENGEWKTSIEDFSYPAYLRCASNQHGDNIRDCNPCWSPPPPPPQSPPPPPLSPDPDNDPDDEDDDDMDCNCRDIERMLRRLYRQVQPDIIDIRGDVQHIRDRVDVVVEHTTNIQITINEFGDLIPSIFSFIADLAPILFDLKELPEKLIDFLLETFLQVLIGELISRLIDWIFGSDECDFTEILREINSLREFLVEIKGTLDGKIKEMLEAILKILDEEFRTERAGSYESTDCRFEDIEYWGVSWQEKGLDRISAQNHAIAQIITRVGERVCDVLNEFRKERSGSYTLVDCENGELQQIEWNYQEAGLDRLSAQNAILAQMMSRQSERICEILGEFKKERSGSYSLYDCAYGENRQMNWNYEEAGFDRVSAQNSILAQMMSQISERICDVLGELKKEKSGSVTFYDCASGEIQEFGVDISGSTLDYLDFQNAVLSQGMARMSQRVCEISQHLLKERSGSYTFYDCTEGLGG